MHYECMNVKWTNIVFRCVKHYSSIEQSCSMGSYILFISIVKFFLVSANFLFYPKHILSAVNKRIKNTYLSFSYLTALLYY